MTWTFSGGRWRRGAGATDSDGPGGGNILYSATPSLSAATAVDNMTWDDETSVLTFTDGTTREFPDAKAMEWQSLEVQVTLSTPQATLQLVGWPEALAESVRTIECHFNDAAVSFDRTGGQFTSQCQTPESSTARIDAASLPVDFRWNPAIAKLWAQTNDGRREVSHGATLPDDRAIVIIELEHDAPADASVTMAGVAYDLAATGAPNMYHLKEGDDPLTWGRFGKLTRQPLFFLAAGYAAFEWRSELMGSLKARSRYARRVTFNEQIYKEAAPAALLPPGDPAAFGPVQPLYPGIVAATDVDVLDDTGVGPVRARIQAVLPTYWQGAVPQKPFFLRRESQNDSYGVLATVIDDLGNGAWQEVGAVPSKGIISWWGLIDRYEIVDVTCEVKPRKALIFNTGFVLDDSFVWAAPFGGVGYVRGRRRWCHASTPDVRVENVNQAWKATGHWAVDLSNGSVSVRRAGAKEVPFCMVLADPDTSGWGSIVELQETRGTPRLRGLLASADGTVSTIAGARVYLGDTPDNGRVVVSDAQTVDEAPETVREALGHARRSNQPDGNFGPFSWSRIEDRIELTRDAEARQTGVFVRARNRQGQE